MTFDLIIKNGTVFDGMGNPSFHRDLGIKEGKISAIGNLSKCDASNYLDVSGMFISPGFIDMHNHVDHGILARPEADNYILQGVTTSVVGNCGLSMAPISEEFLELAKQYLSPFLVRGFDYGWNWESLASFNEKISIRGTAQNIASLVGHGSLRISVKGFSESQITKNEMARMENILTEEMEKGAFGLSLGLSYVPGSNADINELVLLSEVVARYGGIVTVHGRDGGNKVFESVQECIRIADQARVPMQISHFKALGSRNFWKLPSCISLVEKAHEHGQDIGFDLYPYTAGMTTITQLLPSWMLEGGVSQLLSRLKNAKERARVCDFIINDDENFNLIKTLGWQNTVISDCPLDPACLGRTLKDILFVDNISEGSVKSLLDWLIQIRCDATMVNHATISEKDMRILLKHPLSTVISDGWISVPEWSGRPHPRSYGSFPRFLGRIVRSEKLLTWAEGIRKITSYPASRMGIKERGIISEGKWADLVIFDPEQIIDKSDYLEPHNSPQGIHYVFVNGIKVVEYGVVTGKLPGKVLVH